MDSTGMPAAVDQAAISHASCMRPSRRLSRRLTSFWSGGSERTTERCLGMRGREATSRAITRRVLLEEFVWRRSRVQWLLTLRCAVVIVQDCGNAVEQGMV